MTENATQFITPLTFETLTNNRCVSIRLRVILNMR